MSRHLILLETHLPPVLTAALNRLADEANTLGRSMFVTGSTMRDVLAGVQAQELELVVEGDVGHLRAAVPEGLPVRLFEAMAEQAVKSGARPKLVPASIHEYLRTRDYSVNAIALSVTRASRGLLLDPTNGAADIEARELRALSGHLFVERPVKLLELLRLRVRLGFTAGRRTQAQFDEALEAGAHRKIRPPELRSALERVAGEPKSLEILQAWDSAGLLSDLLPAIAGQSLNSHGFVRVHKLRQLVPYGVAFPVDEPALFFNVLTENLSPRARTAFLGQAGLDPDAGWIRLGRRVSKVEKELASVSVHKPSQVYDVLTRAGPTVTLLLAVRSAQRVVQERIRNYLTKYLPTAAEAKPDEPLAKLLDARPKRMGAPGGTDVSTD